MTGLLDAARQVLNQGRFDFVDTSASSTDLNTLMHI
jgi:hypothetical protein